MLFKLIVLIFISINKELMTTSTTPKGRKLSFTPSPGEGSRPTGNAIGNLQRKAATTPRSLGVKRQSPGGRAKKAVAIGRTNAFRNSTGLMVPKVIKIH